MQDALRYLYDLLPRGRTLKRRYEPSDMLSTVTEASLQARDDAHLYPRGLLPKTLPAEAFEKVVAAKMAKLMSLISDMTILRNSKKRRDAFAAGEYRALYSFARDKWIEEQPQGKDGNPKPDPAASSLQIWYRAVAHNFVLLTCSRGMHSSQTQNLHWVISRLPRGATSPLVQGKGKGKSRKLVAPESVTKYLNRIRAISKATGPDDRVFTTIDGTPAKSLYGGAGRRPPDQG